MRVPRLYLNLPLAPNQIIELSDDRHHYLARVLRLKLNHPLVVFNGKSGEYTASVAATGKKSSTIHIESFVEANRESPLYTELAIGMSKGERMDWVMQKTTELGVSRIVPLYTERTEVKLDDKRLANKLQHWQQIVISACEQSQRTIVPVVEEPKKIIDYIATCDKQKRLLLDVDGQRPWEDKLNKPATLALLVGAEGGLSQHEIATAKQHDFHCCALGPRILRTETAPLAVLSIAQQFWGDI